MGPLFFLGGDFFANQFADPSSSTRRALAERPRIYEDGAFFDPCHTSYLPFDNGTERTSPTTNPRLNIGSFGLAIRRSDLACNSLYLWIDTPVAVPVETFRSEVGFVTQAELEDRELQVGELRALQVLTAEELARAEARKEMAEANLEAEEKISRQVRALVANLNQQILELRQQLLETENAPNQAVELDEELDLQMIALDDVNVRAGPTTKSTKVSTVLNGATVVISGKSGDWFQVVLADGRQGYILGRYLGEARADLDIFPEGTAQEQYAFAYSLLEQFRIPEAEQAFADFVLVNQDHPLIGSARIWRRILPKYYLRIWGFG